VPYAVSGPTSQCTGAATAGFAACGARHPDHADLDDFGACYNPRNRYERNATWSEENENGRFRSYAYEELLKRDKLNLDILWLKDESLEESSNLPSPETIAADIAADLETALEQFSMIAEDLKPNRSA
jgi:type I restriction enzyme M protein